MASSTICYSSREIKCLCMKAVVLTGAVHLCPLSDHASIYDHELDSSCTDTWHGRTPSSLFFVPSFAIFSCAPLTGCKLIKQVMLQAYHAMADFLSKQGTMSTSKEVSANPPEQLKDTL